MDRKNFKALTLTVAADIKSSPALYLYEIPTNMPLPVLLLPDTFSINKNTRVKKQNKQTKKHDGKTQREGIQEFTSRWEKPVSTGLR